MAVGDVSRVSSGLYLIRFQLTTVGAGVAYTSGDALGGVFKIPVPSHGIIHNVKMTDPDNDVLTPTIHIFDALIAGVVDNLASAFAVGEGVTQVLELALVPVAVGSYKYISSTSVNEHYYSNTGFLYGQCTTTGTPSIAAGLMPWVTLGIIPADHLTLPASSV